MAVDWTDPCARFAALNDAYMLLISGGQTQTVEYLANGVTRRVGFSKADLGTLRLEMERARQECSGSGELPRRFAISGGARRRPL